MMSPHRNHVVRAVATAALAVVAVLVAAPAGWATDGGSDGAELIETRVGAYAALLYARPVEPPGMQFTPQVDFTLYLHDRDGTTITDATVAVTVCTDAGCFGPEQARRIGNAYEVLLSESSRGEWFGWTLRYAIDGPAGPAEFVYPTAGEGAGPGAAGWLVPAAGGAAAMALLAALALLVARVRRHQRVPSG